MLQIQNIHKQYKTGDLIQKALDGVSLNLRDNEFVAILGPSGSGKTTLLNIIGGLDRYDSGDLIINGISTKKYKDRDWDSYRNHTIGFVFQSYNLIPHQSVLANVELALTISGISKSERKKKAMEALEKVGLGNQGHKKPNQMSGGQMQRVAIARALVNNPDILLADEPTGALDSETSVQVMELLKEVAKDRLVVMVTHNPELAEAYATRIVKLKDGKILSDTDPFEVKDPSVMAVHQNMGKASMSFLTALSLSFNNLKTKKARTILTAFAGSIGIIGIAMILSLSNGVNTYIQSIEQQTLSEYPLSIQSSGFNLAGMMMDHPAPNEEKDETEIRVSSMITNMFSTIGSNDLISLKQYLESSESNLADYAQAVEYSYSVTPQIYSADLDNIHQVHPDSSFSTLGLGSGTSTNAMMSKMMSTDVFFEMPSNASLYEDQYDVKAGKWPTSEHECVLVLTKSGRISDFMLYKLGLRDYSELEKMIAQFSKNEDVTVPEYDDAFTYEDILGIQFKVIQAKDLYAYDDQYQVYKDKSEDKEYMRSLIEKGETLEIVGIVQPKQDATATMLMSGINYPSSLTRSVIQKTQESDIVKKQLATPAINVFTNQSFDSENQNSFDMNSLFTVDTEMMKKAFSIDTSKLNISFEDLDLSNIQLDFSSLPPFQYEDLFSEIQIDISRDQLQEVMEVLLDDFQAYLQENHLTDPTRMNEYFFVYLQSDRAQQLIQEQIGNLLEETGLTEQFTILFQQRIQEYIDQNIHLLTESLQKQMEEMMSAQMGLLASQFQNALQIDGDMLARSFRMNVDQKEMTELMMSLMTTERSSYDNNLKKLGYADFDSPSEINIYPADFESKQEIIQILDNYNEKMKLLDEDKVISYTDYVGTLMSSVTDIINVISYVLIAFVAISLVVSSIMIGVITYISVLERKKEIGILRAMGASKNNVSQVFNAETFIIGLFSGMIGISVTALLLIPSNAIIHSLSGNNDVNAILPLGGAIILIILSVVLTMLSGLIPSRKAAKEDPVTALRTE